MVFDRLGDWLAYFELVDVYSDAAGWDRSFQGMLFHRFNPI